MKRVACIGKKETSPEEQNLLIKIGGWLALQGFTVSSGNAAGSERFFALGAEYGEPPPGGAASALGGLQP